MLVRVQVPPSAPVPVTRPSVSEGLFFGLQGGFRVAAFSLKRRLTAQGSVPIMHVLDLGPGCCRLQSGVPRGLHSEEVLMRGGAAW